jgi:hypothetical protein
MTFNYEYKNYLIRKLTSNELKLSQLDEEYRNKCDLYNDSIKMKIYSRMIQNKKYARLVKKINFYQNELMDLESKYEYKELEEEQMLV